MASKANKGHSPNPWTGLHWAVLAVAIAFMLWHGRHDFVAMIEKLDHPIGHVGLAATAIVLVGPAIHLIRPLRIRAKLMVRKTKREIGKAKVRKRTPSHATKS